MPADDLTFPDRPRSPLRNGHAALTYLCLATCLAGFHLRLSIYSGDGAVLVPNYLIIVPGAVLAITQASGLARRAAVPLFALIVVVTIHPLLTFAPMGNVVNSLRGGAQLLASVIGSLAIVLAASRLPAQGLRRLFYSFWALLMVLAALETYGFRSQMESITESIYAGTPRTIYDSQIRDTVIYGGARPTALASEPSFLAQSWIFSAVLVFLLDKNRGAARSWIRLLVMVAVGYALAPSTSILFVLLATILWHFWPKGRYANVRLVAVVGVSAAILASPSFVDLLGSFGSSETGSFFARVTSGPYVALHALSNYPLLGYGIGNAEGVDPVVVRVWETFGAFDRWPWYVGANTHTMMANGFWWQWISMGLLGGAIFTYLVIRLLTSIGVKYPFRTLACGWIVWYTEGAFESPTTWVTVAFFAIVAVAQHTRSPAIIVNRSGSSVSTD